MFVLDSHCDTPSQIMRLRDLGKDNDYAHVDFPKMIKGGVDGAFFALYNSNTLSPDEATRYALEMLAGVYDSIQANQDKAALALSPSQAFSNKRKGLASVLIGMENGAPIQHSLSLVEHMKYCSPWALLQLGRGLLDRKSVV